ncbi:hypothetical protein HK101_011721 [Irineochytrium annulatum]|nr:hypothetical protein HK101_011721 [Irineochytrium annulatum]
MDVSMQDQDAGFDLFAKVRSQSNSGIASQKKTAMLLAAVEDTIKDQKEQLSPLAYFGALMTFLEQAQLAGGDQEEVVTAVTHLLSLVFVRIPSNILRFKFSAIASTLSSTLQSYQTAGAIIRDAISCIESLLAAQDHASWLAAFTSGPVGKASELRSLFVVLMIFAIDERPKVRRRAHDALKRLLSRPPPPSAHHPATISIIDFCTSHIADFSSAQLKDADKRAKENQVLHVLVFLKGLLPVLAVQGGQDKTRSRLSALCEALLKLPVKSSGTGNTVLTQWVFQVLDSLFGTPSSSVAANSTCFSHLDIALVDGVLRKLLDIRPYQNDVTLGPAWLELVGRGFACLAHLIETVGESDGVATVMAAGVQVDRYATEVYPELLRAFWVSSFTAMIGAEKRAVVERAGELFAGLVRSCITEDMVQRALASRSKTDPVREMMAALPKTLVDVLHRDSWGVVLTVCEAALERLGADGPALVQEILQTIMSIRDSKTYAEEYPFKPQLESAMEAAALSIGFDRFTMIAPLNIFDADEGETRRPYLLAVFGQALTRPAVPSESPFGPSNLTYFTEELLPLWKRLNARAVELKSKGQGHPAKLFETLAHQVFSLFPALCATVPADLPECFDVLAPRLGKILSERHDAEPGEPNIKPLICSGLQALIEGYQKIASLDPADPLFAPHVDAASFGVSKLRQNANKFLNTLCNAYTTVDPAILDSGNTDKAAVLQRLHGPGGGAVYEGCIRAFLTIADGPSVTSYFYGLVKNLLQSQSSGQEVDDGEDSEKISLVKLRMYAVLDLITIIMPILPDVKDRDADDDTPLPDDSPLHVLYRVLTGQLRDADATLQKKTYKSLNLLLDCLPSSQIPLDDLMSRLVDPEVMMLATSGVKRSRIALIRRAVERAPEGEEGESALIEFVPVALSEVMLATKEASEKARGAAYECLVGMGRRMLGAGIRRAREEGTSDAMDGVESDRRASIKEYIIMVVAGMAGESAHMQSASIASLARLIFEFQDSLSEDFLKQLISTVLEFMAQPNREVVKAALGFIKVAAVALPQPYLEDELESIVTSILSHSRDHRSHFKVKVRHILERLIRRFSIEAIEGFVPESDQKLISNIRKRKERLRRKRAAERQEAAGDSQDEDDDPATSALKQKRQMQSRQREFEDAMHGSESELEDSEEGEGDDHYIPEQFKPAVTRGKNNKAIQRTVIREGVDVVDFLDSQVVSRITTSSKAGKRKANEISGKRKADFTTDEDGRMVIAEEGAEDGDGAGEETMKDAMEGVEDLYLESIKGEGAFKRLPDGRIKFVNKRKKEDEAVGGDGAEPAKSSWTRFGSKKKVSAADLAAQQAARDKMLGKQYKAKRAKGDVKKAGQADPFAYIPLSGKIVGNKNKSTQLNSGLVEMVKAARTGGDGKSRKGGKAGANLANGHERRGTSKGNKKHK